MLNFTVGPVMSDDVVRAIGAEQVPYFRTPEFSAVMLENEKLIKKFAKAGDDARVVFITGSGTAAMEATVMNVFDKTDKVLVVNGGSFGQRFVELCQIHEISYEEIKLEKGKALKKEQLDMYDGKGFTGFLVNVHETSTGVHYDIEMISKFCKKNGIFLGVDAISSFLADDFDMNKLGVQVMLTGSQKALACPPGVSVIVLSDEAIKRVENRDVKLFGDTHLVTDDYKQMLNEVDAVYVVSPPKQHYQDIKTALEYKKHILCESPITVSKSECTELFSLAKKNGCILIDAIKTAYATAFARLILLAKEGKIGDIYSVDAVCTSLRPMTEDSWNSICGWGPTAMLPIFDILGTEYRSKNISSLIDKNGNDQFTKVDFSYDHAVASLKVGKGVKSEGELIISGTKGYIYVPAPWWKTDYFEIRYEDSTQNKRYFYQLDGEGIRYELVAFVKAINSKKDLSNIRQSVSETVCEVVEDFYGRKEMMLL